MSKQVAEVLDKARQKLIDVGWHSGDGNGRGCDGSMCAWVALKEVSGKDKNTRVLAVRALVDVIGRNPSCVMEANMIFRWNDDPRRTKAQVLGAFKRAANAERKAP